MLKAADTVLLGKYVTRMAALEMGLTATFMPKPLYGEAGSGMHFHQRLRLEGRNVFMTREATVPSAISAGTTSPGCCCTVGR